MKKQLFKILILIQTLFFISCEMDLLCNTKPDSYYFNKMQPLEWNDNYIFAATNRPWQIQVWDGNEGKLIHTYHLSKKVKKLGKTINLALHIFDMTVINKSIWMICIGDQQNLIKLDIETGEMKYIELDCSVLYLKSFPNGNNGKGCVVVATRTAPKVGVAVRILDLEGNILNKYNVKHEDIDIVDIKGMRYINNEYILTMSKFDDFNYIEKDQKGFSILRLKENGEHFIEDIPFEKILSESFISKNVTKVSERFITVFRMIDYVNDDDPIYVELSIIGMSNCQRFLFEYDYQSNNFYYKDISYKKDDTRTMYSVAKNNDYFFITGNSSCQGYRGFETGLYSITGGKQQKRVKLENANQLHCTFQEDCVWYSKNLYKLDLETYEWDKTPKPQIYKIDYNEQQVYQYNIDGTYTILDWIQD